MIEVMFYLICAAIVPVLRLASTAQLTMIAVPFGMSGYTFSQLTHLQEGVFLPTLARDMRFLPYLFIPARCSISICGLSRDMATYLECGDIACAPCW